MAEPYERGPGLGVERLEDITNALIRDGAGLVSGLDEVSMWQQLKAAVRGHWREREQARKEASNLRAELVEVKAEVERLRDACRELTACARGDFDCLVCGRPCYESDQTPAGYLCSRCCPHPAEVERDEALAALACLRDAAEAFNVAVGVYALGVGTMGGNRVDKWVSVQTTRESVRAALANLPTPDTGGSDEG